MVGWDTMVGDDRVRRCETCKQNVYNISELTRAQADELIAAKDAQMCMRYYHLADGTLLLRDGAVAYRPGRLVAAGAAAALALAGAVAWPTREPGVPAARVVEPSPVAVAEPLPLAVVSEPAVPSDSLSPHISMRLPQPPTPHVQLPPRVFVTAGIPPRRNDDWLDK
jgi:hypothetical protein